MKVDRIVAQLKKSFRKDRTRSLEARMKNLKALRKIVSENEKALCDAIHRDFGKPYFEAFSTEIYTVLNEIDFHIKRVSKWMEPESTGSLLVTFPSKNTIYKQPYRFYSLFLELPGAFVIDAIGGGAVCRKYSSFETFGNCIRNVFCSCITGSRRIG